MQEAPAIILQCVLNPSDSGELAEAELVAEVALGAVVAGELFVKFPCARVVRGRQGEMRFENSGEGGYTCVS